MVVVADAHPVPGGDLGRGVEVVGDSLDGILSVDRSSRTAGSITIGCRGRGSTEDDVVVLVDDRGVRGGGGQAVSGEGGGQLGNSSSPDGSTWQIRSRQPLQHGVQIDRGRLANGVQLADR